MVQFSWEVHRHRRGQLSILLEGLRGWTAAGTYDGGMRISRVGILVVAALAGGALAGVLLSMAQAEPGRDVVGPISAVSPSLPIDPLPTTRPDADTPALQPGLSYEGSQLGANGFEVDVRTPVGWKRIALASDEAKWVVPGNRRNTFVLRIEQVDSQRQTIEVIKAQRITDLRALTGDFRLVQETETSVEVVYVDDNGLTKYGNLRWIPNPDPDVDQALVEISATGRERDQPGLVDLIARVGNGIEARL